MDLKSYFAKAERLTSVMSTPQGALKRKSTETNNENKSYEKKLRLEKKEDTMNVVDAACSPSGEDTSHIATPMNQDTCEVCEVHDSNTTYTFQLGTEYDFQVRVGNPDADGYLKWFEQLYTQTQAAAEGADSCRAVVGLDCEWCPPWFRKAGEAERVSTIQLYSPYSDALVFSTSSTSTLPEEFVKFFSDETIVKVGVNIIGDGARLARDFNCHIRGLVNVATGTKGKKSMQELCKAYCPGPFHVDKNSVENGVRMGNWAAWPLSKLQIKYASIDAVLSYAIFLYQNKEQWISRKQFTVSFANHKAENIDPEKFQQTQSDERTDSLSLANEENKEKNANFFLMHRNRSIPPPNLGSNKEHPRGSPDSLHDVCIVISGVLDSMSRDEMAKYVQDHGGRVVKSITKTVTHLVNDVPGTIGPSKKEKCVANNIPVVGEDTIFELVRSRSM